MKTLRRSLAVLLLTALPLAPAIAADDAVEELNRDLEARRSQIEALNRANPMSESYHPGAAAPPTSAASAAQVEKIQQLLSNPAVQGYLSLFSNPSFTSGIEQVMKSPNRMNLLYAEIGLFVFMLVFRAWRMSKPSKWYGRMWTNAWTFGMGWGLSALVLPSLIIGPGYVAVLKSVGRGLAALAQM